MRPCNTHVVIIGIDRYPGLGPDVALRGARNDAQAWLRYVRDQLHVPARQCHVATGPAMPLERAGSVSGACLDEVSRAIAAMVHRVASDAGSTGIIVFCGHGLTLDTAGGDTQADPIVMCMEDAAVDEGGRLDGVLPLRTLDAILQQEDVAERVTVIVDACHSADGLHSAPLQALSPLESNLQPQARLMLGTSLRGPSFEANIEGTWRGAFSFALLTALSQWRTGHTDGVTYTRASYDQVLSRARSVLHALGYDEQQPRLAGTSRTVGMPFNHPGSFHVGEISAAPDAARLRREVSGEADHPEVWNGDFDVGASQERLFGWVVAAVNNGADLQINGAPSGDIQAGRNRFYQSASFNGTAPGATALTLDRQPAVNTGGQYVLDLVNYSGTIQAVFEQQQQEVPWQPSGGPEFATNLVFGPFTMAVASTVPGQPAQVPVWVEFRMQGGELRALRFWTNTALQGTVKLQATAQAPRVLADPGGIAWHLAPEDPVT